MSKYVDDDEFFRKRIRIIPNEICVPTIWKYTQPTVCVMNVNKTKHKSKAVKNWKSTIVKGQRSKWKPCEGRYCRSSWF